MPVEIRELSVRASVDRQNTPATQGTAANDCSTPSPAESDQSQVNELVQMIKNRNER
ncbi:MAG: DUF5908 family protein [Bacteroidota bacterium]